MATIVVVGLRDGALSAALRIGLNVFLISDRAPGSRQRAQLEGHLVTSLDLNEGAFVAAACAQLTAQGLVGPKAPAAVLAATEKAVLPAAWLRQALRIGGNTPTSAGWCRDKFAMKRRVRSCGIRCADFARVNHRTTAGGLMARLGLPMVLKPVASSGARGTTTARQFDDVRRALLPGSLAESYVHGLEMSVESFVSDGRIVFVNPTEYLLPLWANIVPATLSSELKNSVKALNRSVIEALAIRQGMTHLELFLTPDGPVFSEIALRPPGGYLMELIGRAYDFDAWEALLRLELQQAVQWPTHVRRHTGVWLLHPGGGTVAKVRGLRAARSTHGIEKVHCRVNPGDRLRHREGSGECAAHVVASGTTRQEVVTSLQVARRSLVIELSDHTSEQAAKRPPKRATRRHRAA